MRCVSVPIRGLFNLTIFKAKAKTSDYLAQVSVPIRGLFNLTILLRKELSALDSKVSVPIRGLFNLTYMGYLLYVKNTPLMFPSPSGDYLI